MFRPQLLFPAARARKSLSGSLINIAPLGAPCKSSHAQRMAQTDLKPQNVALTQQLTEKLATGFHTVKARMGNM